MLFYYLGGIKAKLADYQGKGWPVVFAECACPDAWVGGLYPAKVYYSTSYPHDI